MRKIDNANYGISMVCFIAASAFCKLIFNTIGWLKTRGGGDRIILYIKMMNVADACVAIAITQRVILINQGTNNAYFYSGVGEICFSVIALGISIAMLIMVMINNKSNYHQ